MLSFTKLKSSRIIERAARCAAAFTTFERARQGDSRPPAVEVSPPARGSGVDQTSPVPGARRGAGERDNRGVFAVLQLARSAHQRVLHFVQSPLSLAPSCSHPLRARRASPHRPLFYCQPTILTCARNVRRSTKVFMEISFRMRLARLLTRERQYKSTITNGRVN